MVDIIHSCIRNLILYIICLHLFQVWKKVCSHFWLALKLIHYFTGLFLHTTKILILERYSVVLGVCLMNSFASCFALTVGENKENAMFVDGITGLGKCLPIFWEYLIILFSSFSIFVTLCILSLYLASEVLRVCEFAIGRHSISEQINSNHPNLKFCNCI